MCFYLQEQEYSCLQQSGPEMMCELQFEAKGWEQGA